MFFNIYMPPRESLVWSFGLWCHQYADDTQLLFTMEGNPISSPDALLHCLDAVASWLSASQLKLNPTKKEVLWLGQGECPVAFGLPKLHGETLKLASSTKSLGVILDPSLSLVAQVIQTAQAAFYHLQQARQLALYLSCPDLATVIHATVTSRLDYCSSLYAGLPLAMIRKLKLLQNAAARLLSGTTSRDWIMPVLYQLHWLPVEYRVMFKVLVLIFKVICSLGPAYLRDHLSMYHPSRPLLQPWPLLGGMGSRVRSGPCGTYRVSAGPAKQAFGQLR
ncbi:uncharacterized protein LOC125433843 [Sphaerodactylus townsendi]|uniref:uncharacterized protein LOC125433843 n=1 Tax=Sphaerodactylus townsendi TaxID=933632 RepID=UPI002025E629|nr:uncharacterized protein LOC125433843 [Sphaerodactylus townsendi]